MYVHVWRNGKDSAGNVTYFKFMYFLANDNGKSKTKTLVFCLYNKKQSVVYKAWNL